MYDRLVSTTYTDESGYSNSVTYTYQSVNGNTTSVPQSYSSTVGTTTTASTYTYDERGNITKIVTNGDIETRYYYDVLNRLIREDNEALNKTYQYTYDNGGNRLTRTEHPLTAEGVTPTSTVDTDSYEYTDPNRKDLQTKINGFEWYNDAYGNHICPSNGSPDYTWDGTRLATCYCAGTYISYEYNDEGLRIGKAVEDMDGNTCTSEYFYMGTQLTGELIDGMYIYLYVYDANGSILGMMTAPIDWPEQENWEIFWFEKNLFGDVVAVYSDTGTKLVSYVYDAWGNHTVTYHNGTQSSSSAAFNPFRYRGYYYDADTGYYYLQSRYYDPVQGRFISADPASYLGANGDLNSYNLYAYANNNPIRIVYRTNISTINKISNSNLQFNTLAPVFNQIPTNNSSFSLKPLTFSIGLVTPDNPKLPKWMNFSAFYISGHLGFGAGYTKSPGEKGSFGLSFASLDLGIVSMKCDVVTFDEDTALYLGVGALNANASLGLGLSANVEIVSFYFGAKPNEYVSIDGKVYVGWGISFDFSNGIKIGIASGVGFEISLNF